MWRRECPKCRSRELMIKTATGFEKLLVYLSGMRKYRCRTCDHSFRAPDRRNNSRDKKRELPLKTKSNT